MEKTIYKLPDHFNIGNDSEYGVYHYSTQKNSYKNKVIFTKNLINIIIKGEKDIFGASTFSKINNSQLLLLPASSVLMSELNTDEHFESLIIYFSDTFLTKFLLKYDIEIPDRVKTGHIVVNKDEFLVHYEHSLLLLKKQTVQKAIFQVKIEEILLYFMQLNPDMMYPFLGRFSSQDPLVKLQQVVQYNLDNQLSLEELAFLCNMSTSTFKRRFAQVFEYSPMKYFINHKMQKAKILLQRQMKPSEISEHLGYENLSAFSKEFKKHFGVAPTHWQKISEPIG